MRYKKTIKKLAPLLISSFSLVGLLIFSNPDQLPVPLLILPFIVVFAVVYLTMNLFRVARKSKMSRFIALGLSLTLVTLLAMQSIGQLVITDVLIVVGLVAGVILYLSRTNFFN